MMAYCRRDFGHDLLSYLLDDLTEELRSNLAILFSAGHVQNSFPRLLRWSDISLGHNICYCFARWYITSQSTRSINQSRLCPSIFDGRSEPTINDMKRFSFLKACIKEALRINSPIFLLPARWTVDPVILGKYFIPKGTSVVPNVCAVHHNPVNWPEPGKFDPSRFMETGTCPIINIPFGSGPRQCVARQFSLFEVRGSEFLPVL